MSSANKRTIGPVSKAAAGGVGITGSLATVILWILSPGEVSAEVVALAIATIIMTGGALVGGWLVKPSGGDHVRE